jgi:hypothetical protein
MGKTTMFYQFTEDALAGGFALDVSGRAMYVPSRGQWFTRELDATGEPYWAPDSRLIVWVAIRDFLRRTAAEHPRDGGLSRRLGSAETVKAVEFLARSDLAGEEDDLAPGALAEAEEQAVLMLAEFRKGRQPSQVATAAAAAPPAAPVAKAPPAKRPHVRPQRRKTTTEPAADRSPKDPGPAPNEAMRSLLTRISRGV